MKKNLMIVVLGALAALAVVGCSAPAEGDTATKPAADAAAEPK